jgi:hypothetical protein
MCIDCQVLWQQQFRACFSPPSSSFVIHAGHVRSSGLSWLCAPCCLVFTNSYEVRTVRIIILLMKKLKVREVTWLPKVNTTKWVVRPVSEAVGIHRLYFKLLCLPFCLFKHFVMLSWYILWFPCLLLEVKWQNVTPWHCSWHRKTVNQCCSLPLPFSVEPPVYPMPSKP